MEPTVEKVLAFFSRIPPAWAIAAVFLLPAVETGLIVGLLVPAELAVVLGGILASTGRVPLAAVMAASVAGAVTGDTAGYLLGRRYGEDALRKRLGPRWDRAHAFLSKEGALPIFLGRFVPFVRTVLPATAGAIEMPRRRFFPADFSAAIIWAVGSTLLGYYAGRDWRRAVSSGHRFSVGIAAVLAAGLAVWLWRRGRRRRRRPKPPGPARRAGRRSSGRVRR